MLSTTSSTTTTTAAAVIITSSSSGQNGTRPQPAQRTATAAAAHLPQPSRRTKAPGPAATAATRTTTAQANLTSSTTSLHNDAAAQPPATNGCPAAAASQPPIAATRRPVASQQPSNSITHCSDPQSCITLADRIDSFRLTVSVDQAWALIHQSVLLYHSTVRAAPLATHPLPVPQSTHSVCLHRDGSVHLAAAPAEALRLAHSQRRVLRQLGKVLYNVLDDAGEPQGCVDLPDELDAVIALMTLDDDDGDDGGETAMAAAEAEAAAEDSDVEDATGRRTLEAVLAICAQRVEGGPQASREHYRAVCRALVTESLDLREFLRTMCKNRDPNFTAATAANSQNGSGAALASSVKLIASIGDDLDAASQRELQSFGFFEWTRFWIQVVDELRRGVRLKKHSGTRPSQVFELTPYEILMEDIRSRNYELRKVMVDGEVPADARIVGHDAHAIILEFIRSRPPLRKAADRQLAPLQVQPTPREQLMQSIRTGQCLRHVAEPIIAGNRAPQSPPALVTQEITPPPQPQRRIITVDMSLFDDDYDDDDVVLIGGSSAASVAPVPVVVPVAAAAAAPANEVSAEVVHRRRTLANDAAKNHNNNLNNAQHNHRTSKRRHTIVGCQSNGDLTAAEELSPSAGVRPESRESHNLVTINPLNPLNTMTQQALAEWTAMPLTDDEDDDDDDEDEAATDAAGCCRRRGCCGDCATCNPDGRNRSNYHDDQDDDNNRRRHRRHPNNANSNNHQQHHHQQQQQHIVDDHCEADDDMRDISHQQPRSLPPDLSDPDDIPHATPADLPEHTSDRLTLSLEEIVHIRSVMTKAELEGLPVGVHVKEDVERRKVCFLCLRTRFSLFREWGTQCKLCQRSVCNKCHTKMRIPTEHFRNVPVMLLSASLMGSPVTAVAPLNGGGGTAEGGRHSIANVAMHRSMCSSAAAYSSVGSAPTTPRIYHAQRAAGGVGNGGGGGLSVVTATTSSTTTAATVHGAAHVLAMQHRQHQQQQQHGMSMMSRSMDAAALSASMAAAPSGSGGGGGAAGPSGSHATGGGGPRSLPPQVPPLAPRSHPNTLDRGTRFARAFNRSPSQANTGNQQHVDSCHRDVLRGELSSVCNDCRDLVNNICRSSKQTRSSARNKALRSLTLDLSPVYK